MHHVIAGRDGQRRLGEIGLDDERMRAVGVGARVEHAPANASGQGGGGAVQDRREAERRLPAGRRRVGARGLSQHCERDKPEEPR